MAKFTPKTIQNLSNQNTAVAQINYNFETLQTLIDTLLSRDGQTPNTMQSILDMNNNRVLNLPVPVSPQEPARHGDIQQYVDQARSWAEVSEDWAEDAEESAEAAQESEEQAEAALTSLLQRYLGEFPSPPNTDLLGNPVAKGSLYFNSTQSRLFVFAEDDIHNEGDVVYVGDTMVILGYWLPLPVPEFALLNDVDLSGAVNGDIIVWNGLQAVPVTLNADAVPQDNDVYNGSSVQDALDDIINRTSLGVYDVFVYAQGLPGVTEELVRMVASRAFTLPVDGGQSVAKARVAPDSASVTFSLRKNGSEIGTVAFAEDSTEGVFTVSGDTVFQVGDILSVVAPDTIDIAFRDLSLTLACVR